VSDLYRKTFFTPNEAIAPVRIAGADQSQQKVWNGIESVACTSASSSLRRLPTDFPWIVSAVAKTANHSRENALSRSPSGTDVRLTIFRQTRLRASGYA